MDRGVGRPALARRAARADRGALTAALARAAGALEAALVAVLAVLLPVLLAALVGITVAQVGLRYLAGSSLIWAEEAGVVLLILLAWSGVGLLWLRDAHIGIDLLPSSLAPGPRRALLAGLDLLAAASGAALAWTAQATVDVYWTLDLAALGLPAAVKYLPVQAGAALLCVCALLRLRRRLAERDPDPPAHGDAPA